MTATSTVLVTGGSGFVGGYCIARLLETGWRVRTTIRARSQELRLRQNLSRLVVGDRFEASIADLNRFEASIADLNRDEGWDDAVSGCEYVLHVASPVTAINQKDENELIRPAREGTLRVLEASRRAGVKRIVLTSSVTAVANGERNRLAPYTEADWADADRKSKASAYERSKTLAERAAWEWSKRQGGTPELVAICPGGILGPVPGTTVPPSIQIIKKLLDRSLRGCPRFGWPLVDVRDLAELHVLAMTAPAAAGQRYIAAGKFLWMIEIANILRRAFPDMANAIPNRNLPNMLVRIAAIWDPVLRERLFLLDKSRPVSAEKAFRELQWSLRPVEATITETARSLLAAKLV